MGIKEPGLYQLLQANGRMPAGIFITVTNVSADATKIKYKGCAGTATIDPWVDNDFVVKDQN